MAQNRSIGYALAFLPESASLFARRILSFLALRISKTTNAIQVTKCNICKNSFLAKWDFSLASATAENSIPISYIGMISPIATNPNTMARKYLPFAMFKPLARPDLVSVFGYLHRSSYRLSAIGETASLDQTPRKPWESDISGKRNYPKRSYQMKGDCFASCQRMETTGVQVSVTEER